MDSCVMGIYLEHRLAYTNKTTRAHGIGGISNVEEIQKHGLHGDCRRCSVIKGFLPYSDKKKSAINVKNEWNQEQKCIALD